MENPVVKALFMGVAVVLTIVVIAWGIATHNKTEPLKKTADSSLATINQNLGNNQFSSMNGQDQTGAYLRSLISTNASPELKITVITTKDKTTKPAGVTYTADSYNITDINNDDYIEPTVYFTAVTSKSTNGTINAITFTQK